MTLPTLEEAEKLFDYVCQKTDVYNVLNGLPSGTSRQHYLLVAQNAKLVAAKTPYLNAEKAYILGLLHDYGEYIEQSDKTSFHGTAGYDEMMRMGFNEVARVCLSHSFFEEPINPEEYKSYNQDCLSRASQLLNQQGFDDYDRLIHLSDLMSFGAELTTVEHRLDATGRKYNISQKHLDKKKNSAMQLKMYFDKLCNEDVYNIVDIKND